MRKLTIVITLVLTGLAVALWGAEAFDYYIRRQRGLSDVIVLGLVMLPLCACVGWTLCTIIAIRTDEYTRCRKCRHILRGISEPRCPECGEHI